MSRAQSHPWIGVEVRRSARSTLATGPVVLLVIGAAFAGCGGAGTDRAPSASRAPAATATAAAAPTPADDHPPDLRTACGTTEGLAAQPLWLRTSDGIRLYAVEAGKGATTVVLAHEGRDSLCGGWLPYAARLVRSGFRTLLFDFRGNGQSESVVGRKALRLDRDLAAAVRRARAGGARRVFLMGASLGGAAAVQNGASLPVSGIVSLSGTRIWPGFGINHYASLPRLRVPFLYLGTTNDSAAPANEARDIYRRVGSKDKQIVIYDGVLHGTEFVDTAPFASRARALILRWLRRHERG
jgi:alpha-beta hydrolase superfamily lysophospholipase